MSQVVLSTVLLVCACVLVDGASPIAEYPNYVKDLWMYDAAVQRFKSIAPKIGDSLTITEKKFHYGLFVLSLDYLSRAKTPGCGNYKRDYLEIVRRAVSIAWNKPKLVARRINRVLKEIEYKLNGLRYLVEDCKNITNFTICNEKVVNRGFGTTRAARLVYHLGTVAEIFLDRTYQTAAEEYTIVKMLAKGKRNLEPLATALAWVRADLHPRGDMPCFDDTVFDE